MDGSDVRVRRAQPKDTTAILQLYQEGYAGQYPDLLMSSYAQCAAALRSEEYCWMVAEAGGSLVASVVYRIDFANRLAKAFGALVLPEYRGHKLTERLMVAGQAALKSGPHAVDVVYATTRTVALAPQKLVSNLGYRKLGIFPNVHKTDEYETHCLSAWFTPDALACRFTAFELHPKLARLYEIVRGECGFAPLAVAKGPIELSVRASDVPAAEIELETIVAPRFVQHRFRELELKEHHWFFPFQEPNLLLTTADQGVEVFVYFSEVDKHCVLIGIRDLGRRGYSNIFESACRSLRALGARYIEFIIRADELRKIETALKAQFLPCAYFPALERGADGTRYDYVVFSRSFEILDFSNVRLEGVNHDYLMQYFDSWKEISLAPVLLQR